MNAAPQINPLTQLVEQRVRSLIGELMVNNAALVVQVEALQRELAEMRGAPAPQPIKEDE